MKPGGKCDFGLADPIQDWRFVDSGGELELGAVGDLDHGGAEGVAQLGVGQATVNPTAWQS
ncbi:MAG: hypothetical protein QNJ44_09080 [Rhodobacter sp.]|nr:hypothetical protein [Rhodobacter sp.]